MSKKPARAKAFSRKKIMIKKISASPSRTKKAAGQKLRRASKHSEARNRSKEIRRKIPNKKAKTTKQSHPAKVAAKNPASKKGEGEDLQNKKPAELSIEKLEKEYNEVKELLVQKRKSGVDAFIEELNLFTIPSKLQLLRIDFSQKDYDKIEAILSEVRASLESAKPTGTSLDAPAVEENPENPFKGVSTAYEEHPLAEDAKNYSAELKKRLSFSSITEKISGFFKKRGGK